MTAAYLKSDFQKALEQQLAGNDRQSPDFLSAAPFVIDCRADAEAFRAGLSQAQLDAIEAWHSRGKLTSSSGLASPARAYAIEQLRSRFEMLDAATRSAVWGLVGEWRAKTGKGIGGIDIILPVSGIRLPYDDGDLAQFA